MHQKKKQILKVQNVITHLIILLVTFFIFFLKTIKLPTYGAEDKSFNINPVNIDTESLNYLNVSLIKRRTTINIASFDRKVKNQIPVICLF